MRVSGPSPEVVYQPSGRLCGVHAVRMKSAAAKERMRVMGRYFMQDIRADWSFRDGKRLLVGRKRWNGGGIVFPRRLFR